MDYSNKILWNIKKKINIIILFDFDTLILAVEYIQNIYVGGFVTYNNTIKNFVLSLPSFFAEKNNSPSLKLNFG